MLANNFIRPILFPSLMFVFMEKMGHLLETYVWSDIREDKAEMLHHLRYEKLDFDFIIVGCGSAGSALARNLSRRYEVLVLDVGGVPDPFLDVPVYAFLLNSQEPVDFAHRTVPQKHAAFGINNNVVHWPAGKQLGGTSTVHTLTYTRGNVQGFDSMASELGDGKWSTDNILKYYEKIESYKNGWYDEPGHHGKRGTMEIEGSPVSKFIHNFIMGASELGYRVRDPNYGRKNTEGVAYADNHMRFGRRQNAYKGNLKPNLKTRGSKLVIRKFSLVTKINLEPLGDDWRATGVTYERHGRTFSPTARMEVISSAGTLGSAKLLMLSGIGPKEDLEKIGIRSLVDLPVGKSLQDMYGALMGPFIVKQGYSFVRDRDVTMQSVSRWLMFGDGPVASGRVEATFDLVSNFSKAQGKDTPDIHGIVIAASADPMMSVDFEKSFNLNHKSIDYLSASIGEDSFYQTIALSSPKQTGYVKLRDANPWTSLEIDPKYFHDPEDMEVLLDGMRIAIKLVETTNSMRDAHGRLWRIPFPGCESHEFTHERISDEYLRCLARHSTMTLYRYCGTAPIGFEGDNNRVVDRNFRVINVRNLRVVDASVLQLKNVTVSDSTVRMLGEFASDVISEYWRKRQAIKDTNDELNDIFE